MVIYMLRERKHAHGLTCAGALQPKIQRARAALEQSGYINPHMTVPPVEERSTACL